MIRATGAKFGKKNPLASRLAEIKLAIIATEAAKGDSTSAGFRAPLHSALLELADFLFEVPSLRHDPPLSEPRASRLYTFPLDIYRNIYQPIWDAVTFETSCTIDDVRGSTLLEKYIYVIGPNRQFRYHPIAQPIDVSIIGRNHPKTYPFHPFLATEFGLTILVAGEFSLQFATRDGDCTVLYVNNVSGHYKPSHWTATELAQLVRLALCLTSSTTILAVANDGASISGPLANMDNQSRELRLARTL